MRDKPKGKGYELYFIDEYEPSFELLFQALLLTDGHYEAPHKIN